MKKLIVVLLVALFIFLLTPQSIRIFQRQIISHEKSSWAPTAQYQLGNLCFWTLKYSQALGCYRLVLSKYSGGKPGSEYPVADNGKLATSMFRTGICCVRIKDYNGAIEAYEQFAKAYPSDKNAGHARNEATKLREVHQSSP